jgi:hypothetical protein
MLIDICLLFINLKSNFIFGFLANTTGVWVWMYDLYIINETLSLAFWLTQQGYGYVCMTYIPCIKLYLWLLANTTGVWVYMYDLCIMYKLDLWLFG